MPGYHWVRRRAVPRIRRSGTARALAYRLVAAESRGLAGHVEAPLELAAGRLLAGIGIERLPVIVLSLVGLADEVADSDALGEIVDAVIDEVAELQLLGAGFRPIFLLDTPAFGRARSYGYLVELVTSRTAWCGEAADWQEYIAARVASMAMNYQIAALITIGARGLDDVARATLESFSLASEQRVPR
jgi:hypothetical protein